MQLFKHAYYVMPTAKERNGTLQISPSNLTYTKVASTARNRGLSLAYFLQCFHHKHPLFLYNGGMVSIHHPQSFSQKDRLHFCFLFNSGKFECGSISIDNIDNPLPNKLKYQIIELQN